MAEALRYKDKVTIVTGGSKGIGRGCVEVFVQHGSKVVFCSRGETEGRDLEAKMNSQGPGSALFVRCDMTKEEDIKDSRDENVNLSSQQYRAWSDCTDVQAGLALCWWQNPSRFTASVQRAKCSYKVENLIDTTVEKYGQIDCVINNAGFHPPVMKIDEISGDDFRKLLDTNLVSYFLVAKYAMPYLRKTKGCLIQDSSLVAEIGQPGSCTYVATKGGVTSLTKALAIDEAEHGVRVNTFAPGNVWTPMWEDCAKLTPDYHDCVKTGEDTQLLGRFGTIEECGKACLFLAADATFCTGINILLSGGAELNYGVKNPKAKTSGKFI